MTPASPPPRLGTADAFIWDDGRCLEGLGDPVSEAAVLNQPLRAHQINALGSPAVIATLDEIPAQCSEYLLLLGHVFVTRRLVRRFRDAARRSGARTTVLTLKPCIFTDSTSALADLETRPEGVVYGLYYRSAAGPPTPDELANATPIIIAIRETRVRNDLFERRQMRPTGMDIALTTEAVLHIRHWSHLITANYVALFCLWFDLDTRKVFRYVGAGVRGVVRWPWRLPSRYTFLSALTVRGRGCRVHPSAVVEASVLGNRVEIGPFAAVRGCVIGDDVKIDAHVNANFSAIGHRATVSFHAACNLSVVYPEAMLSFPLAQMALLGRRSVVLGSVTLMDMKDPYLEREILVRDAGRSRPSGRKILGPCIGHDTVVAAGARLAPGLCVPNGAYLVSDSQDVFKHLTPELEPRVPYVVRDGRVVAMRPAARREDL